MKQKNLFILSTLVFFMFSGCYTLLRHPDVTVTYEDEKEQTEYSEAYDVYVDEDCNTCHEQFNVATHFSPLMPGHPTSDVFWSAQPWWFDNKYVLLFGDGNGEKETVEYQHVKPRESDMRADSRPVSNQYIPAGRSSASGNANVNDNGSSDSGNVSNEQSGRRVVKSKTEKTETKNTRKIKSSKRSFNKRN